MSRKIENLSLDELLTHIHRISGQCRHVVKNNYELGRSKEHILFEIYWPALIELCNEIQRKKTIHYFHFDLKYEK